ncbi:MAG: NAD(+) kinase [Gammaproteobacteria bacterium]|nr:NAD(+) kinase [Gammaproteobacteria bacterium]MDH5736166.1 NAD(+) kinase [Gammaproteobacteria bacterium]
MNIKTIGIITKNADEAVASTVRKLYDFLTDKAYTVIFDDNADGLLADKQIEICSREVLAHKSDLAIVVGGDGTFLSAVRTLADYDTPVMGINLGRLGFLVDISPVDMLDRLESILAGDFVDETRFLLHAQVISEGKVISEADAFNDVVVHIRDVARMIEFETYINGQFVNFQRADGLVVSTPTGSTAYALSSGGPLLHATLDAMVLVPICPHTLTNRPLVVNSESHIEIVIGENKQSTAQVTFDGQTAFDAKPGDRILISKKSSPIHLIHPSSYDYYEILRAKLRWATQL